MAPTDFGPFLAWFLFGGWDQIRTPPGGGDPRGRRREEAVHWPTVAALASSAVHSVAIDESYGGQPEIGSSLNQVFG